MKVGNLIVSLSDLALIAIAIVVILAYVNGWGGH